MGKLQEIIRKNGSSVNSVNLPKEEIEKLNWKKGDDLDILAEPIDDPKFIKISKKEDGHN